MSRLFKLALVVAVCWGAWHSWKLRRYEPPKGMLVAQEPKQSAVRGSRKMFSVGEYQLEAQASYHVRARLLHRMSYQFDASAAVSPLDFALGWGPMSMTEVLDQLDISQGGRFYTYRWRDQPPLPAEIIAQTSANTHLIPADARVLGSLDKMRQGQVIELTGYLVNVSGPNNFTWQSSLTRADTGGGACEVMWVESAEVIENL